MNTNNPEIRALTLDEIDAVSGGADGVTTLWHGFGVDLKLASNSANGCVGILATSTSTGDQSVLVGCPM